MCETRGTPRYETQGTCRCETWGTCRCDIWGTCMSERWGNPGMKHRGHPGRKHGGHAGVKDGDTQVSRRNAQGWAGLGWVCSWVLAELQGHKESRDSQRGKDRTWQGCAGVPASSGCRASTKPSLPGSGLAAALSDEAVLLSAVPAVVNSCVRALSCTENKLCQPSACPVMTLCLSSSEPGCCAGRKPVSCSLLLLLSLSSASVPFLLWPRRC